MLQEFLFSSAEVTLVYTVHIHTEVGERSTCWHRNALLRRYV